MRWIVRLLLSLGSLGAGYVLTVSGALTLDLGIGRRDRSLGPIRVEIDASPETVFDVIAAPYLKRTPRAMGSKLKVLERGSDLVLAAHFTPLAGGLTATTVETVGFERPSRITFRLVRGPVPEVLETFDLLPHNGSTVLEYRGTLGTDFWWLGAMWGKLVARQWESVVDQSFVGVKSEAERRASTKR